jgi:hypothetical protein
MKLFSQTLELRAIRSIAVRNGFQDDEGTTAQLMTNQRVMASSAILSSVDESFFHYEPCKAAYKRIRKVAETRSRILGYDDLLEDPTLDEEFRDVLREDKKKSAKSIKEAEALVEQLDHYRKARIVYDGSKKAIEALKGSKVDTEELIEDLAGAVAQARSKEMLADKFHTLGKDGNAAGLLDRVLDPSTEKLYKTGYTEFDNRNGGVPTEGVWILAGTTSGGKSVLRMNLCDYMYRNNNLDVLTVSMEMNEEKEYRRLVSAISGVPLWKIAKGQLDDKDRETIRIAWKKFHKHGKKNNCRYTVFSPTRGLTAEQCFMLIKPFGYRVVAIDYVSLFEGVDVADQWKTLSAIARQAKIFSAENKCLVILLAQLDSDDDRIRYSKGMLEHADACWTWNYSKPEQRELHEIPIQQRKARDQELFPFPLKEEFHIMRVSNPDNAEQRAENPPEEEEDEETSTSKKGNKNKSNKKKSSNDDEIEFDVD